MIAEALAVRPQARRSRDRARTRRAAAGEDDRAAVGACQQGASAGRFDWLVGALTRGRYYRLSLPVHGATTRTPLNGMAQEVFLEGVSRHRTVPGRRRVSRPELHRIARRRNTRA